MHRVKTVMGQNETNCWDEMGDEESGARSGPKAECLLDNSALGIFDELHQLSNIFAELTFSFDLL